MPEIFRKIARAIPYVAAVNGAVLLTIGVLMIGSATIFMKRATPAELTVRAVYVRQTEHGSVYRPEFETTRADGGTLRYDGGMWVRPKPHESGDIVQGFVDWDRETIRSSHMLAFNKAFGGRLSIIGAASILLGGIFIWRARRKARPANG